MFDKFIRNWFIRMIDWYMKKNSVRMSYIHKSMIKDEIKLRIGNAVQEVNNLRDHQEAERLEAQRIEHQIKEDGYEAEIESYKKIVEDARRMRKENEKLYYTLISRIRKFAGITLDNTQVGSYIVENVSTALGKLDKVGLNLKDLENEIEEAREKDLQTLRIK